jgi:hypothetical protein
MPNFGISIIDLSSRCSRRICATSTALYLSFPLTLLQLQRNEQSVTMSPLASLRNSMTPRLGDFSVLQWVLGPSGRWGHNDAAVLRYTVAAAPSTDVSWSPQPLEVRGTSKKFPESGIAFPNAGGEWTGIPLCLCHSRVLCKNIFIEKAISRYYL